MKTLFKCKVTHMVNTDDGDLKMTTSEIIQEGVNYTDAETLIHKNCENLLPRAANTGFNVREITKFKCNELVTPHDGNYRYKVNSQYLATDDSGRDKIYKEIYLVGADSVNEVLRKMDNHFTEFSGGMVESEITAIAQTNISEVYEKTEIEKLTGELQVEVV